MTLSSGHEPREMHVRPAGAVARLGALAILLAALAGCADRESALPQPPEPSVTEGFRSRITEAYAALESDSIEAALTRFVELTEFVPESPHAFYHLTRAYARAGRLAEARTAFEKALELGYAAVEQVEADPYLEPLRSQEGWSALVERLRTNRATGREATARAAARASTYHEPSFATLDSLNKYYGGIQQQVMAASRIYAEPAVAQMQISLVRRKLAALEALRKTTPDARLAYATWMEALATQTVFAEMDGRPWTLGRTEVLQTADEILSQYPDSAGTAVAALWKARVGFYDRMDEEQKLPPEVCAPAIESLHDVARKYPGTPGGCQALAEAIQITADCSQRDVEQLRPLLAELEAGCPIRRESLGEFLYTLNEFRLLVHGAPDFQAVDINGRSWHLQELRGQVVLLDFWATWCSPCLAEMPTLVRLRERYPEDRLWMLGISLDSGNRMTAEQLREWLVGRNMSWPQIYDGRAWQAEIARLYNVSSIPFPVLLDAQGTVVAAGDGARGEKLEAHLRELLGG